MKPNARITRQARPALRDAAQQIWLAGLGALALAEEESSRVFETLVEKGRTFQEETVDTAVAAVDARVDEAKTATVSRLEKLGRAVDGRFETALARLGVPTHREIASLTRRVEALRRTVDATAAKTARPARRVAARTRRTVSEATNS